MRNDLFEENKPQRETSSLVIATQSRNTPPFVLNAPPEQTRPFVLNAQQRQTPPFVLNAPPEQTRPFVLNAQQRQTPPFVLSKPQRGTSAAVSKDAIAPSPSPSSSAAIERGREACDRTEPVPLAVQGADLARCVTAAAQSHTVTARGPHDLPLPSSIARARGVHRGDRGGRGIGHAAPQGVGVIFFALALYTTPAHATPRHEPYVAVGGGYFGGTSRVLVGLGPAVGYRFHVTEAISLHLESRWLMYGGNGFTTSIGGLYAFRYRSWAPAVGLQATLSYGQQLRVIDASMPDVPPELALSIQARVAPIRFRTGDFTIAALVFDAGAGIEGGRPSIAISFEVLEIGIRF